MNVFVTGGTGFIGQYVLKRLAESGHSIRCLVRKASDTSTPKEVDAEIVVGGVTDRASLKPAMAGSDAVIHLANLYEFWVPDKSAYHAVNIEGTRNVMEEALAAGVSKVVHISSQVIYGKPEDDPFTEESTPAPRYSLYAETKYQGDLVAWALHKEKGLPLVVVYPGCVVGPGDPKPTGRYVADVVNRRMPAQVFCDSVMTWVDVRDVAEIIVRALEKEGNIGEQYIAGAERLTIGQVNEMISRASGVPLPGIRMPSWMAFANGAVLTFLGSLFKFRPMLGMASDQLRCMYYGFSADGSKATRELGVQYRPIETTIEDVVAAL